MRRNRIVLGSALASLALLLMALSATGANKPDAWRHDYSEALKEAKRTGRPLLLHFSASWCPPCRQMEKDVLHQADVQELLTTHFVAVHVDCSQPNELAEQFQVQMLPSDLVMTANETVLLKSQGGRDRTGYLKLLRQVLGKVPSSDGSPSDRALDQQLVQKGTAGTARVDDGTTKQDLSPKASESVSPQPQLVEKDSKKFVDDEKLLIGMDRYSPVSLARNRQWRKGKSEFALVYQGVVYLLFDAEEYATFQADPAKYAPRLLGCDPVVLWSTDKAVPGSTQYGAYFDGELFLFSSATNRDMFKSSPTRYSRTQHVLKVDQIDGPRWR